MYQFSVQDLKTKHYCRRAALLLLTIVIALLEIKFKYEFVLQNMYFYSSPFLMQIVAIRDIIPPAQRNSFNDVYISYELMDTDLHQIIRSNQALSEEHCQVFISYFNRKL